MSRAWTVTPEEQMVAEKALREFAGCSTEPPRFTCRDCCWDAGTAVLRAVLPLVEERVAKRLSGNPQ